MNAQMRSRHPTKFSKLWPEEKAGSAISYDDVLDFVLSLDRLDVEASALR